MKGERGFALVITLIITALLVALCAEFVNEVFVDTSARQSFTDGQQASIMAASGVDAAIKAIQLRPKKDYTSQADLDQLNQLLRIEDETGTLRVTVEDESGKLNLNACWGDIETPIPSALSGVAGRLVTNLGLSTDILDSLKDWRDKRDNPEAAGAENSFYQTLRPPYRARNGKLATVEEMRLVRGIDGTAYRRLSPLVNVLGDFNTKININTAPKEIIEALGDDISPDLAKEVLDYRKDHPFMTEGEIDNVSWLKNKLDINSRSSIGIDSAAFRLHSAATVGETTRVVEAVWDKVNNKILYWREY